MKDRIRQIMESQHMTQQVFADYIQQSPATLSSIFNGRTRPTLNIVEAIKKKIPNISIDWLMFGSGDMYLPSSEADNGSYNQDDLGQNGSLPTPNPMLEFEASSSPTPQNGVQQTQLSNSVRNTRLDLAPQEIKTIDKPQRRITEIRVFYDDQTWETFIPQKK
jgi:transcriptional regulator with XRE-family HTH domain